MEHTGHCCKLLLYRVKLVSSDRLSTSLGAMGPSLHLATSWEKIHTVRGRFRKEIGWLQWPCPNPDSDLDDLHSPSTRAIELNVEVLRHMIIDLQGFSVDIKSLQTEAREGSK